MCLLPGQFSPPLPLVKHKKFSSDNLDHCVFAAFERETRPSSASQSRGLRTEGRAPHSPRGSSAGAERSGWDGGAEVRAPQSRVDLFQLPRSNVLAAGFVFCFLGSRASSSVQSVQRTADGLSSKIQWWEEWTLRKLSVEFILPWFKTQTHQKGGKATV